MYDLKRYYDNVNAAQARVQNVAGRIDAFIDEGKTSEALALKSELDQARADYDTANQLYLSMAAVNHNGSNDPAANFVPAGGQIQVVRDEADQPFASTGDFLKAVRVAGIYPSREDARLRPLWVKDAATGLSEGVPADGGYLLKPQESGGILERMYQTGKIMSRIATDPIGAGSNSMIYNGVDETSRVNGSRHGGILGYWGAEADTITATKPKWYQFEEKLKKVSALCYATDEQIEDTTNLESWLLRVVPDELRFKAEDAVFEGDGVGKPLGIMNSPCLISVARQTLLTISYIDIVNMWSRRWGGISDYVWLINQDVNPQLDQLYVTSSLAIPANFITYGQDGVMRMKGAPVVEVEYAQTLGTNGDIVLAGLSQYQAINKGDVKSAYSMHVAFVSGQGAYRFTYRFDGQPSWGSAVTPMHGTNTQSPFVSLATATA